MLLQLVFTKKKKSHCTVSTKAKLMLKNGDLKKSRILPRKLIQPSKKLRLS